jgi:hypothetical protein
MGTKDSKDRMVHWERKAFLAIAVIAHCPELHPDIRRKRYFCCFDYPILLDLKAKLLL